MLRTNLSLLLFLTAATAFAADWSEFRGPNGTGIAADAKPPVQFSEKNNVKWKVAIHGKGWSSPVIWGGQIWVTTATEDGKEMSAVCLYRETGKTIHDTLVFKNTELQFCHPTNSYASCTPVIEQGRIYVHFGTYGTACLDTKTGKKIWERRDFKCDHWRGPASSPVIHGNSLVVAYDGYDVQYVTCLDKRTGKTIWKRDRNIDYGTDNGDRKKAYSTAKIIKHGGKIQVISPSAVETISYDLETGKEHWRVRHGGMNAAAVPAFHNGLVYIQAGSGPMSLIAVKPNGSGDVTKSHIEWNLGKGVPKRPSPLVYQNKLFLMNDDGIASCVDANTGDVLWKKRIGGKYRASPVLANGHIYFPTLEGPVFVIKASDTEPSEVIKNELENGCQATPAIADKSLYVRTIKHLYCIRK